MIEYKSDENNDGVDSKGNESDNIHKTNLLNMHFCQISYTNETDCVVKQVFCQKHKIIKNLVNM